MLEIGCGTGNYIIDLSKLVSGNNYFGFDISDEMLNIAKSRSNVVEFKIGDAEKVFPYGSSCFNCAFAVDVIHHIVNIENFFKETARCLKPKCSFLLVTDLENNIKNRSLSKFFPEILQVELDRYPTFESLKKFSLKSGLFLDKIIKAEGYREIDDEFIEKVKRKCSSSMRLISNEAHSLGIERLIIAQKNREKWFSTYSILKFEKLT